MTRKKDIAPHLMSGDEMKHIRDDLDSLRSNVVALTRAVRHDVAVEAVTAKSLIRQYGRDGLEQIEDAVKARPGQSMLAAFAVGIGLSLFARR